MNFIDIAQASTETTELAVTGEKAPEGLLNSLGIHGTDIAFQFLNFVIVSLIIWFLILKPVTKKMSERQKLIEDSLKNADEIEKRLSKSQVEYQERIDQAKIEARKILDKSTEEALENKEKLKQQATKEIEDLIEQAKQKIQLEKERVLKGIKEESATLLSLALEKIIGKKIDVNQDKEIIEEMIHKMK
jgi:F-type H+-transporting ATPase subunit b